MKKILLLVLAIGSLAAREKTINFTYANEDISNIINTLANKENKNIILPQVPLTQKVNIKLGEITLETAWRYVNLLLDLAGYALVPHNSFLMIVKNDQNANREMLPLYVGFHPKDLPFSDERIRVIATFNHLKVPEKFDPNDQNPMTQVLQEMLSPNKSVMYNQAINGVVIADTANNITTVLDIFSRLDQEGDDTVVEKIQLYNVEATTIANLIKTQILALTADTKPGTVKNDGSFYFGSQPIQLIADASQNIIVLMGAEPSIERLKDLIAELDQPTESGRSILHVYELQYLDAEKFAPVIDKLLKGPQETGQATKEVGGPRKTFEGVIVIAEASKEASSEQQQKTDQKSLLEGSKVFTGGNRLVIAARQDDWQRIKALIQSLDLPQPQVIIEVMIVDATIDETKILGTQLRNPSGLPLPKGVTAQAAFLNTPAGPIINGAYTTPPTAPVGELAADLLTLITPPGAPTTSLAANLAGANPGSMIVSFNDPNMSGIWGVLQILDQVATIKVLSHPFLIARNNQEAEAIIADIRRDLGQAIAGQAAVISTKIEDITAQLRVAVVPRVSSIDRVSMQIAIDVNEFTSTVQNNFTRLTRKVNTNAIISSGQVLVLGGLTTLSEVENNYSIPILSRIPLIGSLFQWNNRTTERQNILIIMAPTVVDPKVRGGMTLYTNRKIDKGYEVFEKESVLGSPRDPVTRTFFGNQLVEAQETTYNYLSSAQGDFVKEFKDGRANRRKKKKLSKS